MISLCEIGGFARESRVGTLLEQRPTLTTAKGDFAMADRPNIPVETLRQLLAYDPETGKLTWLERPREMFNSNQSWAAWNGKFAGLPAFQTVSHGYAVGLVFRVKLRAHRVLWALHYGEWPDGDIDHINGDPSDNRISNLRAVDHQTNMLNQKRRATNKSGAVGVRWYRPRGKWRAEITVDGRNKSLGYFPTFDEAVAARKAAEARYGFHANHGRAA